MLARGLLLRVAGHGASCKPLGRAVRFYGSRRAGRFANRQAALCRADEEIEMLGYYLQLAVRSLRRNPVLTTLMIAAVGVGIGASMTMLTNLRVDDRGPYPRQIFAAVRAADRRLGTGLAQWRGRGRRYPLAGRAHLSGRHGVHARPPRCAPDGDLWAGDGRRSGLRPTLRRGGAGHLC